MILKSFSIKNYRSILKIKDIKVCSTLTTFIGKNNQGKSNILNAISLVFDTINTYAEIQFPRRGLFIRELKYRWENDFPVQKQSCTSKNTQTLISVSLLLSKKDREDYFQTIGFKISPTIKVCTVYDRENIPKLTISSKGISSEKLESKETLSKICSWVMDRMNFQYIPAIRPAELADNIANNIISLELSQLAPQKKDKLDAALKQIEELQKPILQKLEMNLSKTLKEFIPDIKKVSLTERRSTYRYSRRYSDDSEFYIKINDGSETMLSQKGDGIKSLVTLGMMRQKGKNSIGKGLILAIEEPESHLHPEAIRQIALVVQDISKNNQVLLTSHSPLFVNRDEIQNNIIVGNNSAKQAKNMKEIRDTLGVIASDNLINSEFVLVVEGETDKKILQKYLSKHSEKISKWLEDRRLCFEVINGVDNLEHSLNKLLNMSSKYFCILDSDTIAKNHVKNAKRNTLLLPEGKDVSYYTLKGLEECELEDLINPKYYKKYVEEKTGVDISACKAFRNSNKKWGDRIKLSLQEKGKIYEDEELLKILNDIKKYICNKNTEIDSMLISNRDSSISSFPEQIEKYFDIK